MTQLAKLHLLASKEKNKQLKFLNFCFKLYIVYTEIFD